MAFTYKPPHTQAPNVGKARVTGANTTSDASTLTNIVQAWTAGANGGYISQIEARNSQTVAAASAAKVLRVWLKISGVYYLIAEVAQATATRTTAVIGAVNLIPINQPVPAAAEVHVGISVYGSAADQTDFIVYGADY
jgi:hypothetical protein